MIQIRNTRSDKNRPHDIVEMSRYEQKQLEALSDFIIELGHRGIVRDMRDDGVGGALVAIRTKIMQKLDDTIYWGTQREMEPFLSLASLCGGATEEMLARIPMSLAKDDGWDQKRVADYLSVSTANPRLHAAIASYLRIRETAHLTKLFSLSIKELAAFFVMALEEPDAVEVLLT